ncbi:MAG: hypothetical protein ABFD82_00745 [Syntrophaceae bacterium]
MIPLHALLARTAADRASQSTTTPAAPSVNARFHHDLGSDAVIAPAKYMKIRIAGRNAARFAVAVPANKQPQASAAAIIHNTTDQPATASPATPVIASRERAGQGIIIATGTRMHTNAATMIPARSTATASSGIRLQSKRSASRVPVPKVSFKRCRFATSFELRTRMSSDFKRG